ncbi:hypothetical protein TSUD_340800 [Trifolium subterraneum]|uniref:Uncharacterized protein n=1 Tax=Trifolium subterraneum TaxID=3900 RepID=A0A2Z6MN59_TRISU|nr:hypothetical protein TSUD_340800 [Trifolium subterraneum]
MLALLVLQPRIGANAYDLEERILQHLAIVASNERIHQLGQREGQPIQQTPQLQTESSSSNGSTIMETNAHETHSRDRSDVANSCPINQNRARSSGLYYLSDTLRSRLGAVSTRYKESISKGTRCWKNKLLLSRSSTITEVGTDARMNTGIPRASHSMKFIGAKKKNRVPGTSLSNGLKEGSIAEASNQNCDEVNEKYSSCDNNTPTASSTS